MREKREAPIATEGNKGPEVSVLDRDTAGITLGPRHDTVSYQLRRAQDASFQALVNRTGNAGLRPGRYAVLQVIADNPGVSQTVLSRAISRDKTTLTPILQDMHRAGLIERLRDPNDGRSWMMHLTDKGFEMLATLAVYARRHDEDLDEILGDADRAELLRILKKITRALT